MLKVFVMSCRELANPKYQKRACTFLSREREAHALSLKKEKDRALSVGAGLLLAFGMLFLGNDLLDVSMCTVDVEEVLNRLESMDKRAIENLLKRLETAKKEKGKPYFPWEGAPKFSISHSGEYAVVAFCDEEVGVDIQQTKEIKSERMKERVFHKDGKEKEEDFFFVWTAKEAYVKCTGEGLSRDFTELFADKQNMCIEDASLYEFPAPGGYHLMACVKSM